jgi:hypothetical protein
MPLESPVRDFEDGLKRLNAMVTSVQHTAPSAVRVYFPFGLKQFGWKETECSILNLNVVFSICGRPSW